LEKGFIERREMLEWIAASPLIPLKSAPVVYSDLGILLLGFVLEKSMGASIAELFQEIIREPLGLKNTGFRTLPHASAPEKALRLPGEARDFVATANCGFHGRLLQGEVDDNNCWALGGATAHAGLFSTLEETQVLLKNAAETALRLPEVFLPDADSRPPFTRGFMLYPGLRPVDGDEWAGSIGHTGFVGTSAWFHPATDSTLVCLGNRVHPDRNDARFIETRLNIQRSAWEELS
jgi:CubicO group peptidase (beta-lactamase class C family)